MNYQILKNETLNCELIYITDSTEQIWFRAKTVASAIGYTKTNTAKVINKFVDSEDRCKLCEIGVASKMEVTEYHEKKSIFINESGLYSLMLSSKHKSAKKFRRWVTSEVLPTIRKTGKYKITNTTSTYNLKITSDVDQIEDLTQMIDNLKYVSNTFKSQLRDMMVDDYTENDSCDDTINIVFSIATELERIHALDLPDKMIPLLLSKLYKQFNKQQLTHEPDSDSELEEGSLSWIGKFT